MRRVLALSAIAALVVASCASDVTDTGGEILRITDQDNAASSVDPSTPIDPGDGIGDGVDGSDLPAITPDLADEVDIALTDLSARLGSGTAIEVVAAHDLTWPDGSLGCPEPGMTYTQALIEGYRIELAVGGDVYEYHGAFGVEPFLCDAPVRPTSATGGPNRVPPTTTP